MPHSGRIDYQTSSGNISMPQTGPDEPVDHRHKQLDTYTNLTSFRNKNQTIIDKARTLKERCESTLSSQVLEVDINDELAGAVEREWPQELEKPPEPKVSYWFYRALRHRPTTAAGMIRRRYEQAARGLNSRPHLDILKTADIVLKEARLQKENLAAHLDQNTDAAEKRVVEGAFDWCVSADIHINTLNFVLDQEGDNQDLREEEITVLSEVQVRQAQAVFSAQFNATSMDLQKSINFLQSQFAEQADSFYNRILIPALDFRLAVGRKIMVDNNQIAQATLKAANALDKNFEGVLQDQVRRNLLFQNQIDTLIDRLLSRERYRDYIKQLAPRGIQPAPDGLSDGSVAAEEMEFWENHDPADSEEILYTPNLRRPSDAINADHSSLTGVDDDDAHDQYVLAAGDILTGDLDATEDVRIDGVDVSEHRHTGEDGTHQISGEDIEGGTLDDGHVNLSPPAVPENIRVANYKERVNPPGVTVIDAELAWEGPDDLSYEIEIADRFEVVSQQT